MKQPVDIAANADPNELRRLATLGALLEYVCKFCPNASVLSITSPYLLEETLRGIIKEDVKQRQRNEKYDGGGRIKLMDNETN